MKAALILAAFSLAGCASAPVVVATPTSCSALLPASWKEGVSPPPMPADDTAGSWIQFGDAAIGKLDQANGRTLDAIGIVERCEARDAVAVKRATRGWLARLLGGR